MTEQQQRQHQEGYEAGLAWARNAESQTEEGYKQRKRLCIYHASVEGYWDGGWAGFSSGYDNFNEPWPLWRVVGVSALGKLHKGSPPEVIAEWWEGVGFTKAETTQRYRLRGFVEGVVAGYIDDPEMNQKVGEVVSAWD